MQALMRLKVCYNYLGQKLDYAALLTWKKYTVDELLGEQLLNNFFKNAFTEKMTYYHKSKGLEMEPTISAHETLLVRKLPFLDSRCAQSDMKLAPHRARAHLIFVGDVVVLKDPLNLNNHVVRRVAALKGSEMVSTNEEDEPFVLEDGMCWVLSDNKKLKPEESNDSRTYGPISITNILGRVIYRFQTVHNQGLVRNSRVSMQSDQSVVFVELDFDDMQCHTD